MIGGEPGADHRADVIGMRGVARVAEPLHEAGPEPGHAAAGHPAAGPVGEAEAGHRRHDHVEGVGGVAAVRPRVGEERDQLEHLDEGAGPAVGDEQRHRRRPPPALVDHVDAGAVDPRAEVRHRIHRPLDGAPVEAGPPVPDQLAHVGEARAIVPARALHLVRPARSREPLPQIVEARLRHVHHVRLKLHPLAPDLLTQYLHSGPAGANAAPAPPRPTTLRGDDRCRQLTRTKS